MTILKQTKTAWIREPGHPIGKPAPGYLNCQCGQKVRSSVEEYAQKITVTCALCGQKYTGNGWLID